MAALRTDGYDILSGVFTLAEMRQLADVLSYADVDRTRAGARHILGVAAVRAVATDSRILAIAHSFIGPSAIPFRATLFDKSPDANWLVVWHQDTALPLRQRNDSPEWGPWSTKGGLLYAHAPAWALEQVVALRVSLDDSLKTNGPLRVLPGTHQEGVLTEDQIEQRAREMRPVDCLASAGSVVAIRPLTVHASSKARSDHRRRVLHIEYAASTNLGAGIKLVAG